MRRLAVRLPARAENPVSRRLDDAIAAAVALRASGITRLVIAGDSAGGGIGLAATTRLAQDTTTRDTRSYAGGRDLAEPGVVLGQRTAVTEHDLAAFEVDRRHDALPNADVGASGVHRPEAVGDVQRAGPAVATR